MFLEMRDFLEEPLEWHFDIYDHGRYSLLSICCMHLRMPYAFRLAFGLCCCNL